MSCVDLGDSQMGGAPVIEVRKGSPSQTMIFPAQLRQGPRTEHVR
jgi:hypothetical protein